MTAVKAYAAASAQSPLAPSTINRRAPGPKDVAIAIEFCGICHSDLHQARNEWHNTIYPCVPGHEIVGRVAAVGSEVTKFKAGDRVGVGCLVDSCRTCASCKEGYEQFCLQGAVFTYNAPDAKSGGVTYGGYSQSVTVDEAFVLRIPAGLEPAAAAPLLCAGITTYAPLRRFGVGPGQKVGVVGLGGLGHMALKIANALGAEVTLFTSSPGKSDDARRLGARHVVVSKDAAAMASQQGTFDFIIDTVSADHDINAYLMLLKRDGTLVLVGAPEKPLSVAAFGLIFGHRKLAGSLIGGIAQTQEMLDFCASHKLGADIELITIDKVNDAYERMLKSDVRYRFVIDMSSLR